VVTFLKCLCKDEVLMFTSFANSSIRRGFE
jgi:hypothetical protein